jgi:hypothetical protein
VPLQLIMAKTRHKNPRTAMRYTRPGGQATAIEEGRDLSSMSGVLAGTAYRLLLA